MINSHGTIVKRAPEATPSTYTTIASLRDITPPRGSRNTFEQTPQDVDAQRITTGYRRYTNLMMKMNFIKDDATQDAATGLLKSFEDGDLDNWQVIYPDGEGEQFAGYIVGWGPDGAPVEGALEATVEVAVDGDITHL